MSSPFRLLRFRSDAAEGWSFAEARRLLAVHLDDLAEPVGYVWHHAAEPGVPARWSYILADGRPTGLQSTASRHDLENRIHDYYFEDLIADQRHTA